MWDSLGTRYWYWYYLGMTIPRFLVDGIVSITSHCPSHSLDFRFANNKKTIYTVMYISKKN